MARYYLSHQTRYHYAQPVAVSHHAAHLRPLVNERQQLHHFNLGIRPQPEDLIEREDYFGNTVHQFSIPDRHADFSVECDSEVTVVAPELPFKDICPAHEEVREALAHPADREDLRASEFRFASPHAPWDEDVAAFAAPFFPPGRNCLEAVERLTAHLHDSFEFDNTATDVSTPVAEVLRLRRGVCQDFAHLMISALRGQGLAARYVSGYILNEPPPGQPKLEGADASHAWVALYLPCHGWIALDPTNRQYCGEEHITTAVGRDYADVPPLQGAVTGGGAHTLQIAVTMTAIEPPSTPRLLIA